MINLYYPFKSWQIPRKVRYSRPGELVEYFTTTTSAAVEN